VPAPEGLVGDLFLPSPETTWTRVRAIAGVSAAILPQSFGGIAATLLKLPLLAAGDIDGGVPVVGAVVKQGTAPAFGAVGIHVKAGDRFVDQLTRGPEARFVAKLDEASRVTLLTPKQAGSSEEGAIALGVLGNYLLVAEKLEGELPQRARRRSSRWRCQRSQARARSVTREAASEVSRLPQKRASARTSEAKPPQWPARSDRRQAASRRARPCRSRGPWAGCQLGAHRERASGGLRDLIGRHPTPGRPRPCRPPLHAQRAPGQGTKCSRDMLWSNGVSIDPSIPISSPRRISSILPAMAPAHLGSLTRALFGRE